MTDRWTRQRNANRSSGGGFWKPKDGENLIRVFPFKHTVRDYDLAMKRYPPEPVEDDDPSLGDVIEEFFAVSRRHFKTLDGNAAQCNSVRAYDGSFHGECGTCDAVRSLYKGTDDDKKTAKKMRAQTKFVIVMCDVEQTPPVFQIWDAPTTIVDFILMSRGKKKYQSEDILGFGGRDLSFVYNSKPSGPQGYYTAVEWMDRGQEVDLPSEEMGEAPDLLSRKQYAPTMYHSMFPIEEDKEEKKEEAKEEPKKEEPSKPRRRKVKTEPAKPPTTDLKIGDTVYFMEDDERIEAVVTNPEADADGFFRVKVGTEEYDLKHEELVA